MSRFRKSVPLNRSKKMFTATAKKVLPQNGTRPPMRGGYRL